MPSSKNLVVEPSSKSLMLLLCPERHAHMLQERARLIIVRGSRHDSYVHASLFVDPLVRNLWKNQLVMQADGVISPAIEGLAGHSAKVAHPRQNDVHQPVEEFIHAVTAQCDQRANRLALAHFERRNRLLGPRNHWLLSRNLPQFVYRGIEHLRILR